MRVLEKYVVSWQHDIVATPKFNRKRTNPIMTNKGVQKVDMNATTQCFVLNENTKKISASSLYIHPTNHYDRKVGVLESFKLAVAKCPIKETRQALWDKYWEVRKPTVKMCEDTVDLLNCIPYINYELKKVIQYDEKAGYNEGWQEFNKKELVKRLSFRVGMYRDGSDHSLIAIIKLCVMGFINFKRKQNGAVSNEGN